MFVYVSLYCISFKHDMEKCLEILKINIVDHYNGIQLQFNHIEVSLLIGLYPFESDFIKEELIKYYYNKTRVVFNFRIINEH